MKSKNIYFAGSLFCHKDLTGNMFLAEAIDIASENTLHCILPQNLEQTISRAVDVRNQDLIKVIECDLALFNFDGTDLDSGTIVEFMMAKMLDIPSVILRTDFRHSGDQSKDGEPWNLMCSNYPRTAVLLKNGMAEYQKAQKSSKTSNEVIQKYYQPMAKEIVHAFEKVQALPSLFQKDQKMALQQYLWAVNFPGGGLSVPAGWCEDIVNRKIGLGLI